MASIDERIGKNLARYRGDMSQRELANRVRDAGLKWTHLTVASIERGERPLRASESVLLMQILGIPSFDALLSSEDSTKMRMLISKLDQDMTVARASMIRLVQHQKQMMSEFRRMETDGFSELDEDVKADLDKFAEKANDFVSWMSTLGAELEEM